MRHGDRRREHESATESAIEFYREFKSWTVDAAARIRNHEPLF